MLKQRSVFLWLFPFTSNNVSKQDIQLGWNFSSHLHGGNLVQLSLQKALGIHDIFIPTWTQINAVLSSSCHFHSSQVNLGNMWMNYILLNNKPAGQHSTIFSCTFDPSLTWINFQLKTVISLRARSFQKNNSKNILPQQLLRFLKTWLGWKEYSGFYHLILKYNSIMDTTVCYLHVIFLM